MKQTDFKNLAKKLNSIRFEKRMTHKELAKDLGVSTASVSRWLSGKNKPQERNLYHLKKYIDRRQLWKTMQ